MQLHPRIMIAVVIALVAALGHAQDAIFQGNEARTGEASELRLQQQPEVLWKFVPEPPNGRLGGVLAAGERVFVSDEGGRIYAARASDDQLLWTHQGNKGRSKMPLVMGDIAYFATSTSIVALSVLNGETVWSYDIPQGANETSPLMVANLLLVCGYDGIVYALDAQAGTQEWTQEVVSDVPPSPPGFDGERARLTGKSARPTVAASDGKTLFQPIFDQSRVVALDGASGQVRWSFSAGGWIHGNPVVAGDAVYIGSQDDHLYCLDKNSGKVAWSFKTGSRIEAGVAVHGDAVYVGSCDGQFYRLAAKTGEKQWSFECDHYANGKACPIYVAPLVTNDTVYLAGMEGQIYALQTSDGSLRWKMRPTPDAEIEGGFATDGRRLFVTTRPNRDRVGEMAVFAIGPK